jgi:hypothetical protein
LSEGIKEGITIQRVNYPRVRGSGGYSADKQGLNFRIISIKIRMKKERIIILILI